MAIKHIILTCFAALLTYYFGQSYTDAGFNPSSLDGKNVVITGASYGIGEHIAYHYAKHGANVFITARTEHLLQQVVAKCKHIGKNNRKYGFVAADMLEVEQRKLVIEKAIDFLGEIDQLILNHAKHPPVYKWNGEKEQLEQLDIILNVNTISFIHLMAAALPSLRKTSGAVAVVGSGLGRVPTPFTLEYQTSKFALDGFFSGLRYEFKATKEPVSITYCIIGLIATENGKLAVKQARKMMGSPDNLLLSTFPPALPEDAAYAIMSATTQRKGELYFPQYQMMWLVSVLRSLWPRMEDFDSIGLGFNQK